MKLGLTRRGDYPEPIARELDQLVGAITTSYGIEHDAEGRQKRTCAKWTLGADQSLTTNVLTRVAVSLADTRNLPGELTFALGGILRIGEPGSYQVLGQLRFASNVTGARAVQLRRSGVEVAFVLQGSLANAWLQATEIVNCEAGETIELWGYQTSGGALAVESASGQSFLRIVRVA
jgi:hypothetical protein